MGLDTYDFKEGVQAFLEKRKAHNYLSNGDDGYALVYGANPRILINKNPVC